MLRGGISGTFSKSFSSAFRKCPAELVARVRVVWFWGKYLWGVFRASGATVPTHRISGHSHDRDTHIGLQGTCRRGACTRRGVSAAAD